eukprot:TRINITY_DN10150_c0_g2_i1.p1 TRINITY_DN10150_c0_g2~~TRINITY_DN10150_c0_g2_i1.p1  ORF type:complete len:1764 (-),score=509.20 TRINITY_DN10150_c0_g2_i1:217-5508(-)
MSASLETAMALRQEAPARNKRLELPGSASRPVDMDGMMAWLQEGAPGAPEQLADVETLAAAGKGLDDLALGPLATAIVGGFVPRLRTLDLSRNSLTDEACILLADGIAALRRGTTHSVSPSPELEMERPGLRTLLLAGNQIGRSGAEAVAYAFFPGCQAGGSSSSSSAAGSQVEYTLSLSENMLGDRGVSVIAGALKESRCKAGLLLCDVGCSASGCSALVGVLPQIVSLDLGYNPIPTGQLLQLAGAIKAPLERLGIAHVISGGGSRGFFRAPASQALAEALAKRGASLTSLTIASNDLQDEGLRPLAESLIARQASPSAALRELDIAGNRLHDGNQLAKVLASPGSCELRILNLESNELNDLALIALSAGVAMSKNLRDLNLARNRFGDAGVEALTQALLGQGTAGQQEATPLLRAELEDWLRSLEEELVASASSSSALPSLKASVEPGLQRLDLSFNMVTDEGAEALAELCEKRGSLWQLGLYNSSIGAAGCRAFEDAVLARRTRATSVATVVKAAGGDAGAPAPRWLPQPLRVRGLKLFESPPAASSKGVAKAAEGPPGDAVPSGAPAVSAEEGGASRAGDSPEASRELSGGRWRRTSSMELSEVGGWTPSAQERDDAARNAADQLLAAVPPSLAAQGQSEAAAAFAAMSAAAGKALSQGSPSPEAAGSPSPATPIGSCSLGAMVRTVSDDGCAILHRNVDATFGLLDMPPLGLNIKWEHPVRVTGIVENSPASRLPEPLLADDLLMEVNGVDVSAMQFTDIQQMFASRPLHLRFRRFVAQHSPEASEGALQESGPPSPAAPALAPFARKDLPTEEYADSQPGETSLAVGDGHATTGGVSGSLEGAFRRAEEEAAFGTIGADFGEGDGPPLGLRIRWGPPSVLMEVIAGSVAERLYGSVLCSGDELFEVNGADVTGMDGPNIEPMFGLRPLRLRFRRKLPGMGTSGAKAAALGAEELQQTPPKASQEGSQRKSVAFAADAQVCPVPGDPLSDDMRRDPSLSYGDSGSGAAPQPEGEEDEPESEAPDMPERTEVLERQVAALRQDVNRISRSVSSQDSTRINMTVSMLHMAPEDIKSSMEDLENLRMVVKQLPFEGLLLLNPDFAKAIQRDDQLQAYRQEWKVSPFDCLTNIRRRGHAISVLPPNLPPPMVVDAKTADTIKSNAAATAGKLDAADDGPVRQVSPDELRALSASLELLKAENEDLRRQAGLAEKLPGDLPPGGAPTAPPKAKGSGKGEGKGPAPPPLPGSGPAGKGKGKGKAVPPPPKAMMKGPPGKAPGGAKAGAFAKSGGDGQDTAAPFHRKLYWKPIDLADSEGTLFSETNRERPKSMVLDTSALTKMFEGNAKNITESRRKSCSVLDKVQNKPQGTKLLSDHRARNIAIVLKRLPCSMKDLTKILKGLNWENNAVSTDDLEQIQDVIPAQDEAEKLLEHKSPEARIKLRDVEQMVLPLALLSRASARVRLICIGRNARSSFGANMRALLSLRKACTAIQSSTMLKEVMLLALDLGNYINHGDSKKGARAISVGSLLTLRDFKAGRNTALHFLCASMLRADGTRDVAKILAEELTATVKASAIQLSILQSQVRAFQRDLDVTNAECKSFLSDYAAAKVVKDGEEQGEEDEEEEELADLEEYDDTPDRTTSDRSYSADDLVADADATRFVEDVMKVRGSARRRLRSMRKVIEKLNELLAAEYEKTVSQAHITLKFCGMAARRTSRDLPGDFETLLQQLSEFMKVFKHHWEEVRSELPRYEKLFEGGPAS